MMQMGAAGVPTGGGGVWTDPDLSNASYDSVSFDVDGQDSSPFDCFIKPDGLKLYVVGHRNDSLYQYTLGSAWDLSTASYDNVLFDISSQDTGTLAVFFKPDGSKFFIAGNATNAMYEYDMSTNWDISTASYTSNSHNVASEDTVPVGVFFRSDGLQMYVVGLQSDRVHQYLLSSAWDVSTASYDSKSLSVLPQSDGASGVFFNPEGSKVWVSAASNDSVYQYSMSTNWDISTASYDSISFSVSAQDNTPRGFFFGAGGDKLYVVGTSTNTIYQYSTA